MILASTYARRLVDHGYEASGPSSRLGPAFKRGHGQPWFDETNRNLFVYDETLGFVVPVNRPIVSGSAPRYIADMFRAPAIDTNYKIVTGNDSDAVAFAISNGTLKGTTGNNGTGIAADGIAISGPSLGWTNGTTDPIEMLVNLKLSAITNVRLFIGFTDVLPSTTFEQPFSLSGSTYTSTATDGCGFLFDTAATDDTLRVVGVANDTDATHVDTGLAPVADTYNQFYLRVDAGTLKAYLDGTLVATVESAIRTTIALVPIIVAVPTSTTARVVTAEYLFAK